MGNREHRGGADLKAYWYEECHSCEELFSKGTAIASLTILVTYVVVFDCCSTMSTSEEE